MVRLTQEEAQVALVGELLLQQAVVLEVLE
jgi:hypothetical protein